MSCFPHVSLGKCIWFASVAKQNIVVVIIAGIMFFTGWWFIVDAEVMFFNSVRVAHLCGVMATVSLLMVNSISDEQVRGEHFGGGCMSPRTARVWLFLGFVIAFASLLAAAGNLFIPNNTNSFWPGLCVLFQNALIFASSLTLKFGRIEEFWG